MRASYSILLSLGGVFQTIAVGAVVLPKEQVPNEILVQFKEDFIQDKTKAQMNALYKTLGVRSVQNFEGQGGLQKLTIDEAVLGPVDQVIRKLQNSGQVEYAQPNYILRLPKDFAKGDHWVDDSALALEAEIDESLPFVETPVNWLESARDSNLLVMGTPSPLPSPTPVVRPPLGGPIPLPAQRIQDPGLKYLYGLPRIGATELWKTTMGNRGIVVAVIDTGVDYNHEDLSYNLWRNAKPRTADIVGYDFVHNDGLPYDDQGHGTHTAGTIGAVALNGKGIAGVVPDVTLMSLKFLSADGGGTTSDAIRAITYAVRNGARILSNSWGGPGDEYNPALFKAIQRAEAAGVLFVAAAGNEATDNDNPATGSYPASFQVGNMISVAATDSKDRLAEFSNYGQKSVHVAAPGVDIVSTFPGGKYAKLSGTSMACPHVAGAAALLWALNPKLNYQQVRTALLETVDRIPGLERKVATGGRIQLMKAAARAAQF